MSDFYDSTIVRTQALREAKIGANATQAAIGTARRVSATIQRTGMTDPIKAREILIREAARAFGDEAARASAVQTRNAYPIRRTTGGGSKADRLIAEDMNAKLRAIHGDHVREIRPSRIIGSDHSGSIARVKHTPRSSQSKRSGKGARSYASASAKWDRIAESLDRGTRLTDLIPNEIPHDQRAEFLDAMIKFQHAPSNRARTAHKSRLIAKINAATC